MQRTRTKRSKSNERLLMERLQRARLKPRAWVVALVLAGFARIERGTGKRIASVYHQTIAGIAGMSVENVRRALKELTTGSHPLYAKRNATGRRHTIYGNNDFELTTTGAVYVWIEDATPNLVPTPQQPPPAAQAYDEAPARRGYKPTARCLTRPQIEQMAEDMVDEPDYATMLPDGQDRIAEHHALRRHLDGGCRRCEEAVARQIDVRRVRCGCGTLVLREGNAVFDFWEFARGVRYEHQCDTSATADVDAVP